LPEVAEESAVTLINAETSDDQAGMEELGSFVVDDLVGASTEARTEPPISTRPTASSLCIPIEFRTIIYTILLQPDSGCF
jgi:hypothetical protein